MKIDFPREKLVVLVFWKPPCVSGSISLMTHHIFFSKSRWLLGFWKMESYTQIPTYLSRRREWGASGVRDNEICLEYADFEGTGLPPSPPPQGSPVVLTQLIASKCECELWAARFPNFPSWVSRFLCESPQLKIGIQVKSGYLATRTQGWERTRFCL